MSTTFHAARLSFALLVSVLAFGCAETPVTPTPTPTPVAAPVISCPASQSLTSPLATPIPVVYSSPSVSGGASPITTSCTPASGTTFPIGSTTISCTAIDAQQRSSSCSLTVAVSVPPRLRLTKFVAFGDSITYGEDGTYAITAESNGFIRFLRSVLLSNRDYPTVLRNSLVGRYALQADSIAVLNRGEPGEAASDPVGSPSAVSRFSSVLPGQQVVLLMEGSNDVNAGVGDSKVIDAALINLQKMLRAAKAANVVAFIATIPPMNPTSQCIPSCRGGGASLVPSFDDRIRQLATSEGVTLVDVYKAFNGDLTLLSTDGLHPNASGYERIADAFSQSIKATLEVSTTLTGLPNQRSVRRLLN